MLVGKAAQHAGFLAARAPRSGARVPVYAKLSAGVLDRRSRNLQASAAA
ncbi:hypothetical protein ACJMQP_02415 [Rhodopseudomonas palustris]